MQIPYSKDIRAIGSIGARSRMPLCLKDVLDHIPIPEGLIQSLKELSDDLAEASFYILIDYPGTDHHKFEGRGRYWKTMWKRFPLIVYSKGTGSVSSLKENRPGPYAAFGPVKGSYLYDPFNRVMVCPRAMGTQYIEYSQMEFLHALRIFVNLINLYNISDIQSLIESKICIPVSMARFDGLSEYLEDKIRSELSLRWQDKEIVCGSISLVVPSDCRIRSIIQDKYPSYKRIEAFNCLAKAIKELFLSSCAIYSPSSVHRGNIYFSRALCPVADYSDILFIDNLSRKQRIKALAQFLYRMFPISENYFLDVQPNYLYQEMIGIMISDLDLARPLSKSFVKSPKKTCLIIAQLMEDKRHNNHYQIPGKLLSRITNVDQYLMTMRRKKQFLLRIMETFSAD